MVLTGFLVGLSATSQENRKLVNDRSAREINLLTDAAATSSEINRTVTTGGGVSAIPLGVWSSPYLNEDFVPGKIILAEGVEMKNVPLRFDVYHQQLQFIDDSDTLAIANPDEVSLVSFDGRTFVYHAFEKERLIDTGIFVVLIEGPCKLLERHVVDYHINSEMEDGGGFIKSSHLYVSKNDRPAVEMVPSRRSVCNLFSDREDEVKSFIKSNHLKMNRYEDVMTVVEFYNSLDRK